MKLLFFIAVIVVFYVIARRMSSHSISAENYRPEPPRPEPVTIDAEDIEEPTASRYEITRYRFAKTDAEHGPPDAEVFYDDLFVDVVNRETGEKFTNLMRVCTPRGLKEEMSANRQETLCDEELFVVLRYDLDTILDCAQEHLSEMYDSKVELHHGAF